MLTRASLKNPYAVFAVCMIVLVLGAVSYQKMRVDIFPEIKIPTILVTTFYRGLSPSEMEGAITLKMEQRFVEASYVEHIESQSLAGMSYIKVFFQPEYSIDSAQSELTSLAYSIIRLLPPGVYPPSVYKFGVSSLPVGLLSVSSESLGAKEIRDLAYFTVRQQIATIPGISFGPPLGGESPADHRVPRSAADVLAHTRQDRYRMTSGKRVSTRHNHTGWCRPMKMLVLIFRNSLQEEILSLLKNEKIQAYTMIPKVHGMGETGAAFDSFTSQVENSLVLLALDNEPAHRMIEAFQALRTRLSQYQQGTAIPMKLRVMPCEEII